MPDNPQNDEVFIQKDTDSFGENAVTEKPNWFNRIVNSGLGTLGAGGLQQISPNFRTGPGVLAALMGGTSGAFNNENPLKVSSNYGDIASILSQVSGLNTKLGGGNLGTMAQAALPAAATSLAEGVKNGAEDGLNRGLIEIPGAAASALLGKAYYKNFKQGHGQFSAVKKLEEFEKTIKDTLLTGKKGDPHIARFKKLDEIGTKAPVAFSKLNSATSDVSAISQEPELYLPQKRKVITSILPPDPIYNPAEAVTRLNQSKKPETRTVTIAEHKQRQAQLQAELSDITKQLTPLGRQNGKFVARTPEVAKKEKELKARLQSVTEKLSKYPTKLIDTIEPDEAAIATNKRIDSAIERLQKKYKEDLASRQTAVPKTTETLGDFLPRQKDPDAAFDRDQRLSAAQAKQESARKLLADSLSGITTLAPKSPIEKDLYKEYESGSKKTPERTYLESQFRSMWGRKTDPSAATKAVQNIQAFRKAYPRSTAPQEHFIRDLAVAIGPNTPGNNRDDNMHVNPEKAKKTIAEKFSIDDDAKIAIFGSKANADEMFNKLMKLPTALARAEAIAKLDVGGTMGHTGGRVAIGSAFKLLDPDVLANLLTHHQFKDGKPNPAIDNFLLLAETKPEIRNYLSSPGVAQRIISTFYDTVTQDESKKKQTTPLEIRKE